MSRHAPYEMRFILLRRGTHGIMVIAVESGHNDLSSNSG